MTTLELCPPGHRCRDLSTGTLGHLLVQRFRKLSVMHNLEEAINLYRVALELYPPGHPHRSISLHSLASCLSDRYHHQGEVAYLDEAITLGRAEAELYPPGQPHRGISLYNLGRHLTRPWKRSQKTTTKHDLDEAIELYRVAAEPHLPEDPLRSSSFHLLALCLLDRYDYRRVVADLDDAIRFSRTALELCPPGRSGHDLSVDILSLCLQERFRELATIHDLEKAVELHRAALELHLPGDPLRSSSLQSLALCLFYRYRHQRVDADFEEAVTLGCAGSEPHSPGRSKRGSSLSDLILDLWTRYQPMKSRSGKANSLRQATMVPYSTCHSVIACSLHTLSMHYWHSFRKQATLGDLDEAICLAAYGLELRLPEHPDYDVSLQKLSLFIGERLARGITVVETITLARAVDNLRVLSRYLKDRFRNEHSDADLHAAVTLQKYVLQLRPDVHASYASDLDELVQCLKDNFHRTASMTDLADAIALEQKALELSFPGDPGHKIRQVTLATCLQMKMNPLASRVSSVDSDVAKCEVSQTIHNIVSEALETMPTRLLDTHTGILCDRAGQLSHFMGGQQYKQLLSATLDEPTIRTAVLEHF